MVLWLRALSRASRTLVVSITIAAAALIGIAGFAADTPAADAASSRYLMCNWTAEHRTQTVYIDPGIARTGVSKAQVYAAFDSWNRLFVKYHGFPIFVEGGTAATADVVIDAHTFAGTWVDGECNPKYRSLGQSHTTLYLGTKDTWRNAKMLAHELGHALGLADHGADAQHAAGHVGYKSCSNYYGVMSYCSGAQTWFLDFVSKGLYLDGQLVRDYWS
jgi:hypothetical protein